MKKRTKRWLRLARSWGIFLGICALIWIILLLTRPNVTWGIIDRYFGKSRISTVSEVTFTDYIEDICDPETQIAYYAIDDLQRGLYDEAGIRYTNGLYVLNDRYFIHGEDFSRLLETTELEGWGSVTMVRGAAEHLLALLQTAEAETGRRFLLGDSYIEGRDPSRDHGNDCYMTEYYDTSEHITGTSVDLLIEGVDFRTYMTDDLAEWLYHNAWRFGFAIRYPFWEGEHTGVFFQPWHIHYVGTPHAALLYRDRMPLEEYLDESYTTKRRCYLVDFTGEDGISRTYVIYRQTPTKGQIYIPDTLRDVEISYDNTYGYYYVTGILDK